MLLTLLYALSVHSGTVQPLQPTFSTLNHIIAFSYGTNKQINFITGLALIKVHLSHRYWGYCPKNREIIHHI